MLMIESVSQIAKVALREITLDLAKGVLVICMVIYHALNCTTERSLSFELMAFLPPTFIFITGYLVAAHYGRSGVTVRSDGRRSVRGRLIVRGVKLVAVFTILNIAIRLTVTRTHQGEVAGLPVFFENWFLIYGIGDGRYCAFEILLPIGYFLVLSPVFLRFDRTHRWAVPLLTITGVLAFAWLERRGHTSLNGQMLVVGLLGMIVGRFSFEQLKLTSKYLVGFLVAYLGIFFYGLHGGQTYIVQVAETVLALAVIYGVCLEFRDGFLATHLQALGQHSLIAYIVQIAVLQLLARWTGRPEPLSANFALLLLGALILTSLVVEFLQRLRARSSSVNTVYKAVFA